MRASFCFDTSLTFLRPSLLLLFLIVFSNPLQAEILDYQGEHIEWDFEVVGHLAGGPTYVFDPTFGGCTHWDVGGGVEMECFYYADAPYYGDIYTATVAHTAAAGSAPGAAPSQWAKVRPYPNHDEYDFLSPITRHIDSPAIAYFSFSTIFIPMWSAGSPGPESYELRLRYYSGNRPEGTFGFTIRILFWEEDPSAIPNLPWLKGGPGENPFLKFCGGGNRPEKKAGGPGL